MTETSRDLLCKLGWQHQPGQGTAVGRAGGGGVATRPESHARCPATAVSSARMHPVLVERDGTSSAEGHEG